MRGSEPPNAVVPPPSPGRPLPLVARKDLRASVATYCGETFWVVKDPIRLEYFRLSREQHAILTLLDGQRSLDSIREAFVRDFPTRRLTPAQIRQLAFDLYEKGLVWSTRPGQADSLEERAAKRKSRRRFAALGSLFFIRFPGWDPHRLIDRVYPAVRWVFHPWIVIAALFFCISVWGLLLIRAGDAAARMPGIGDLASWQMLVTLWIALGVAKVMHELGHALACRHFGGESHEIGVAFLIFSPCLYCDVSDSWLLASKWKRIAVASAGMFVEMVLSAAALLVWWNTRPGPVHDLALAYFFVTSISTILFNLNPLLRLDGYYILSDWLEIPNLRQRADRMLERTLVSWCLGVHSPSVGVEDATATPGRTTWFVLYSVASLAYRWFVCFAICFISYQLLRPVGLEHVGLLLGLASAALAVAMTVRRIGRILVQHWDQMTSYVRPAATLAVLTGLAVAALAVPFPVHVEAPLTLQPHGVQHVYVTTSGRIEAALVRPGQRVQKGDVLVMLANFRREDQLRQLRLAAATREIETRVHQAVGDASQLALSKESLRSVRENVADYETQLSALTITAPCDGIVVAPSAVRHRPAARSRRWKTLSMWHGSPLNLQNRGSFVEAGTHLLSLAPEDRYEAVLWIDESDRNDFSVGQDVAIRVDHAPGLTMRSKIHRLTRLASEPETMLPSQTAAATATPIRTASHSLHRVHEAVVLLPPDTPELVPGMSGEARVLITRRSAAGWLWRYLRTTFKFLV